jgi:hypothetical protein
MSAGPIGFLPARSGDQAPKDLMRNAGAILAVSLHGQDY